MGAKKQKALQDRKDHIDRVSKTVGAAIAEKDAQDAADLDAKIKKIQEDAARAAAEDAKRRQDSHNAKVKDMLDTRQRQIAEQKKSEEWRKEEDLRQLGIFKQQVEDGGKTQRKRKRGE